jgi:hypothetical protein
VVHNQSTPDKGESDPRHEVLSLIQGNRVVCNGVMCGADNDPVIALWTEPQHRRSWLQVRAHEAIICVGECAVDAVESNPRVLVSELSPSGRLDNVSVVARLCFDHLDDDQFVQVDAFSRVKTAIPTAIDVGLQSV